jgi:glucose/arabinose dehydrogenase
MPRRALVSLAALAALAAAPGGAVPVPVARVASGLAAPTYVAAPAGDDRLFVVERGGTIRILQGSQILPTPFLDISDRVNDTGEAGLLGLAFAPDYASSRAFYVFYSALGNGTRISRFRANAADPDLADDDVVDEKVVLSVAPPSSEHLGGTVAFGADGMLYAGFGDGGLGDPSDNAQDPGTLLGKMVRIDVSFSDFADDYAIPDDNPFVGPDGVLDEIWALGLRNPFRFSFDRETGDLYIGDVGQFEIEEIDVEPAGSPGGRNYGWDVMEGTSCYETPDPGEPPCQDPSLTPPVHEYGHDEGFAVTGGVVYRGSLPELQGQYLFSDYGSARIWTLVWDGAGGVVGDVLDRTADFAPPVGSIGSVVGFGEDGDGELYVVDLGGEVFRVPEPAQALLAVVGALVLAGVPRGGPRARARTRRR